MDLGSWGDRMSAEQKKAMKERMKPYLEPVYILTFDKTKSIYKQEERLDAPGSGGGRGWGRMMAATGFTRMWLQKNLFKVPSLWEKSS